MAQEDLKTDRIQAKDGDIEITFIGHGSLMFNYNGTIIQVDPFSSIADYTQFPKADLILITHHHRDHLDTVAIQKIIKENTQFIITQKGIEAVPLLKNVRVMQNGDTYEFAGINISAVPAYNIVNKRDNGDVFHPKGEGNGYVLKLGGKNIYIAGDTENIPEMKKLRNIDIAFLPMNLPYTMTPEMVANAAKAFKPKILYPYHFGETKTELLIDLLKKEKEIEVRIRDLK